MVWMCLAVVAAAFAGSAAARLYDRRKWNEIADMLERFKVGKLEEREELEDTIGSRVSFLLNEIRREIQNTSGKEKKESNQIKGLISDISHQLRTPLANIRMYEELLEESADPKSEDLLFLSGIREAVTKSEWLLKNLINASRLETGAINFDVGRAYLRETLAEAVQEILGLAREKEIDIFVENFEDLSVRQNRKWTREVFVNLLENAVKYSPPHSAVQIRVVRQVSYAAVSVRDHGIGIPKDEQHRIFDRFYRCQNVADETGSGLGLYLCRLILLKESGSILAEEAEGGGSVFTVFLKLEEKELQGKEGEA